MAKEKEKTETASAPLTPIDAAVTALMEVGLIAGPEEVYASRDMPDAEVYNYRDPKTNILRENVRIDSWDRGALVLLLKSGLKLRIVSKQGRYYVRAAPGVETELSKWVEEYRKGQQYEIDRMAKEKIRR